VVYENIPHEHIMKTDRSSIAVWRPRKVFYMSIPKYYGWTNTILTNWDIIDFIKMTNVILCATSTIPAAIEKP
jgi:hypothetical protein